MKKGLSAARRAVSNFLESAELPVMLYSVSTVADRAAREHGGRKTELFESLFSYETLLPQGFCGFWKGTSGDGGVYSVDRIANRPARPYVPVPGVFDPGIDMGPPSSERLPRTLAAA